MLSLSSRDGDRFRCRTRRTLWILAVALLWAAGVAGSQEQPAAPEATEYEVKAAFLFQVTRYTEWPRSAFLDAEAPIVIGIFGHDPFGELLDGMVAGHTSQGRPLVVRRISELEDADDCHVLFISRDQPRPTRILDALAGKPVLTVGETDRFLRQGGLIYLGIAEEHLFFEVNLEAARKVGLRLSSRLLSLARRVVDSKTADRDSDSGTAGESRLESGE